MPGQVGTPRGERHRRTLGLTIGDQYGRSVRGGGRSTSRTLTPVPIAGWHGQFPECSRYLGFASITETYSGIDRH